MANRRTHMNQTEECNRPQCWCNRPTTNTEGPTTAGAYGYVDSRGRIRAISVSRSDAIRNARLNGMPSIVHLRTTANGSVACSGPSPVIRWEDWRTGETF